jgi:four helix bundle protein
VKSFEEIEVYQKAVDFGVTIFKLTEDNRINRNIVNQLERAALSISNNIAEGYELQSNKQFVKFLYIAKGSCGECRNILTMTNKLNQIDNETYNELKNESIIISKQLSNFIKYLMKSDIY